MFDGAMTATPTVSYLAPGQIITTAEPVVIRTILGSCVSVALHDPMLKVGGLCHFLLPGTDVPNGRTFRYGEAALAGLLSEMRTLGCAVHRMRAGVFGGARVLADAFHAMHLGERNVEFAFSWLRANEISIVARDVLGTQARRLEFRVTDGSTEIRLLGGS